KKVAARSKIRSARFGPKRSGDPLGAHDQPVVVAGPPAVRPGAGDQRDLVSAALGEDGRHGNVGERVVPSLDDLVPELRLVGAGHLDGVPGAELSELPEDRRSDPGEVLV